MKIKHLEEVEEELNLREIYYKMVYDGFKDKKQEEYYLRTKDFLNSESKILINPGGMGLGKTWATIKALDNSPIIFSFITCPTDPLKLVWGEEFNKLNLKDEYSIWYGKPSCCIKKISNDKFDVYKNCKSDDCEYWKNLQKNGEYTLLAMEELQKLDKELPTYPTCYYKINGKKNCLMPINRLGLKTKKYLIGDYFGFLNRKMFNSVINSKEKSYKNTNDGTLIIDEAHLIPERAKDFLSKVINFTTIINKLKEEIICDFITRNIILKDNWENTIKKLEVIHDEIIKNKKSSEERYTYNDFYEAYINLETETRFTFPELMINLSRLSKEGYDTDLDNYEVRDEPYCSKFHRFIKLWENKSEDPSYKHYFQYRYTNGGKVRFIIDCCDTSKHITSVFRQWNKIVLNSGTIPDLEFFKFKTGIDLFKTEYENFIESYSIKDRVIIFPQGDFRGTPNNKTKITPREITYKNNSNLLNKVLNKLEGRTIIYIQKKSDFILLKSIINNKKKIIDFCSNDDGFAAQREDFLKSMDCFNSQKEAIAIMNISGRVEGFNFENIVDKSSVDNIIIFGYPFPKRGLTYDDQVNFYASKINDRSKAKKWVDYAPVLIKIHQAVCRAKRQESDNPVIILWDQQFGGKEKAYSYMPQELKGEMCWDEDILLKTISLIKNKKSDNGFNT